MAYTYTTTYLDNIYSCIILYNKIFEITIFFISQNLSSAHAAPVTGLSGGIIAAIILVIILVCVAVFALIAAFVLYNRWRVKTEYIPPPSRKGSMRLVS